ncbi:restriction endonuclease subunit S [Rodentibacter sp. Ppn85]|uniref:restriction endonuclease subunit S n=1 Tax=Rodentibacter sp. Ppn85 TaxID=1908525 RepID=UPI00117B8B41|nr:restriction endonuclease subunit S [Rodentibacter sp. Ppn85]
MSNQIELSNITDGTPISYGVVQPGEEVLNGIKFIRGGDISNGKILFEQLRTISNEVSNKYRRTLLKGNEVLISLVGNPGEVAVTTKEFIGFNIARQVGLIRPNNSFNPYFIMYYLISPNGKKQLNSFSLGSVQKVINLKDLKKVKIPKLSIDIQNKIIDKLKTLDEKIELNTQINQTLENITQAIFKSWFIDFDPVRAKATALADGLTPAQAERAAMSVISGKNAAELDRLQTENPDQYHQLQQLAATFPSEFEEVEGFGDVPRG